MGPAKKTTAAPPAEPVPKRRSKKAEQPVDKKKENDIVEVSDAPAETISKLDNQKLLNFLKYRAAEKNKRGEQLQEAQQVLEARCFLPNSFPTISFPKCFPTFFLQTNWSSNKNSSKMQEPKLLKKQNLFPQKLTLSTLLFSAGLQTVGQRQKAELLAAVESQWFDHFEVVWSIHRESL